MSSDSQTKQPQTEQALIGPQTRITLHFSLALDDGQLVDSTFERAPASFVYGDGSLLPGFEKKLLGLRAGDEAAFDIAPEDGFGQPNPNNEQRFERRHFGADVELQPGLVMSFADAGKSELPGVIKQIVGDTVIVDFNHPLAGRTLVFRVAILSVESVPAVELAGGSP